MLAAAPTAVSSSAGSSSDRSSHCSMDIAPDTRQRAAERAPDAQERQCMLICLA
jgi:hypothetical protein